MGDSKKANGAFEFVLPEPGSSAYSTERRTWLPAYAITIQVVTTVLLAIRIISRLNKLGGRPGMDDVFIVLAWILGLVLTILIVYGAIHLGWDRHMLLTPPDVWWKGALVGSSLGGWNAS